MTILTGKNLLRWLAGSIVCALSVFLINVIFISVPTVSADLQTNLDWCMTNSGSINQSFPSNFTYEKCAALAQFYEDTNGDNWTFNTGWFADVNICDWHGIDCAYGPASFISLYNNNLSGSISSLAGLGYIYSLALYNNHIAAIDLSGANITSLDLSNNPISVLDLTYVNNDIVDLYLAQTNITSLDVSHLTGLGYLQLNHMALSSFETAPYTDYGSIYAFYVNNNNLCEEDLSSDTIAFLDHFQSSWRLSQTCTVVMPDGVLAYSGDAVTPPGFVRIVDDTNNPQWMVYMRQYPIGADEGNPYGNESYDYAGMLNYVPASGEAIPSTALKDLLVTSNGTTTWVADGTMYDYGNRSDWVSDPVDAGGGNWHLMSVGGRGQEDIYFADFSVFNSNQNKIRTIYTSYYTPVPPVDPFDRCDTNSGAINIPYQECVGLAYLYTELNGDNWSNNDGRFEGLNINNWETDDCFTPVDEIVDSLGFDWCDENGWFEDDNDYTAIVLTGDGPVKNVYAINLSSNNVQGAIQSGLLYFPELRIIDIQDNTDDDEDFGITAINVTQNPLLEIMDISDENDYSPWTLDLSNNPLLWSLNVDDLALYDIDLSHNTGLEYLDIDGNYLTGINLSGLNALYSVDVGDNEIENRDDIIISSSLINYLDISDNGLYGSIDFSPFPLLTELSAENNNIEDIDLSNNPLLEYLNIESNNVYYIDISANTGLIDVDISSNQITELTISDAELYTNISNMNIDYNGLCYITDGNVISFLEDLLGEERANYQFFCAPRNLEMTIDDNPIEIAWDSPAADASSQDNSTNVVRYTIAWTPDDGSGVIDLGYEWYNNTTHSWDYTIEGLESGREYTITVCAVHTNEGPERSACTSIQATPGGETRSSGGGGGGKSRDYCPNGDYSGSHLDGKCGEKTTDTTAEENDEQTTVIGMCNDPEYRLAYLFSLKYKITTMPTCIDANMDGFLIRSHAAKMMSNYAINVLGKQADNSKVCDFSDMADQSQEMQLYMKAACQLGLMGLETDGVTPASEFNPDEYLDKAQFATILSRLLYGEEHNGNTTCWYCDHVAALQDANVITVTTDLFDPLRRAFAMIMLMRTQKKDYSVVDDSSRGDMK